MKEITLHNYQELFGDCFDSVPLPKAPLLAEKEDYTLPRRKNNTHKYSYGRALIIAGSTGFSGAPVLAANACERSGAGLTTLMVPDSIYGIAASRCDGAVVTLLPSNQDGSIAETALYVILSALEKAGATIDRTCGLHVHFDAASFTADELRTACIRYAKHEVEPAFANAFFVVRKQRLRHAEICGGLFLAYSLFFSDPGYHARTLGGLQASLSPFLKNASFRLKARKKYSVAALGDT